MELKFKRRKKMSFSRWLYMNNQEKMRILLFILPVFILSYAINLGLDEYLLIDATAIIIMAIPIFAYKNFLYVNKVANKYNPALKISFKAILVQTLAAIIVNSVFVLVMLVTAISIWLLAVATGFGWIVLIAFVLSLGVIFGYATLGKLTYYVILHNIEHQQLGFKDYLNNFVAIYERNLKFVSITTLKALAYSFTAVVFLSLVSISGYDNSIGWLIILTSVAISLVIYWIDITVIQYLAREYTK